MIKLKIGDRHYDVPVCYEEVNFGQLKRLAQLERPTTLEVAAAFLDISAAAFSMLKAAEVPLIDITNALKFISADIFVRIKEIGYELTNAEILLGSEMSLSTYANMVQYVQSSKVQPIERMAQIVAFGLNVAVSEVDKMPAYRVIALHDFFLQTLQSLTKKSTLQTKLPKKTLRQFWQAWIG